MYCAKLHSLVNGTARSIAFMNSPQRTCNSQSLRFESSELVINLMIFSSLFWPGPSRPLLAQTHTITGSKVLVVRLEKSQEKHRVLSAPFSHASNPTLFCIARIACLIFRKCGVTPCLSVPKGRFANSPLMTVCPPGSQRRSPCFDPHPSISWFAANPGHATFTSYDRSAGQRHIPA